VCSRFKKGSRSAITAFMVLALFFSIASCDNEGIVGGELTSGEDRVETSTFAIEDISVVSDNGFSGLLSYSGIGIVNDPVYGTITSSGLLKPSITQAEIDNFSENFSLKLMLHFTEQDTATPPEHLSTTTTRLINAGEVRKFNTMILCLSISQR